MKGEGGRRLSDAESAFRFLLMFKNDALSMQRIVHWKPCCQGAGNLGGIVDFEGIAGSGKGPEEN